MNKLNYYIERTIRIVASNAELKKLGLLETLERAFPSFFDSILASDIHSKSGNNNNNDDDDDNDSSRSDGGGGCDGVNNSKYQARYDETLHKKSETRLKSSSSNNIHLVDKWTLRSHDIPPVSSERASTQLMAIVVEGEVFTIISALTFILCTGRPNCTLGNRMKHQMRSFQVRNLQQLYFLFHLISLFHR